MCCVVMMQLEVIAGSVVSETKMLSLGMERVCEVR